MKKNATIKILETIIKNKGKTFTEIAHIAMLHPYTVKRHMTRLFNDGLVGIEGFKQNRNGKSRQYGITPHGRRYLYREAKPKEAVQVEVKTKTEIQELAARTRRISEVERFISDLKRSGVQPVITSAYRVVD